MSILALTYLLVRFVHCSSFVRLLFVFCSSFVRLTFPLLHSLSLGEGWGEDILFGCLSYYGPRIIINLVLLALLAFLILLLFHFLLFTTLLKIPFHRYCLTHLPSSEVSK